MDRITDKLIVAVIPARGDSKRLPHKNIYPIAGKPMLFWAVEACRRSRYVQHVFVSTEDTEIKRVALELGAEVVDRPDFLAQDNVFKQRVICHAARYIQSEKHLTPDVVVSLQPNSPQISSRDLDRAIETFFKYNRKEIFSVDRNLMQNAAFRILSSDVVCLDTLSIHAGVFVAEYVDVHTLEDVRRIEETGELQARLVEWGVAS
jgi:CMP-N-acetylneuraminic acid synthetase